VQQSRTYATSSSAGPMTPADPSMHGSVSARPVQAPRGSSSAGPISAPKNYSSADGAKRGRSNSAGPMQEPSGHQQRPLNQYGQLLQRPPHQVQRETPSGPHIVKLLENFYKLHAPERIAKAGEIAKLFGTDIRGLERCLAAKYNGATLANPQPRQVYSAPRVCRAREVPAIGNVY